MLFYYNNDILLKLIYLFSPFWDIVVLTAGDEDQKQSYQQQIERKKTCKEIPSSVRLVVKSYSIWFG